jgi:gluconate 2-dehydrogenase gamma chain
MSEGSEVGGQGSGNGDGATASTETTLTRRRALQILGAVPVATALGAQQPTHPMPKPLAPPTTGQSPSTDTVGAQRAPKFFNKHEWATVAMLVDYIIPRDDHSGSATDAKVPEYMDFLLAEKDANPANGVAMHGGLAWLDTECHRRFQKTFVASTDKQRREVLDDIAYPDKAKPEMRYGVNFFNRFRDMTASGFFSSAIGYKDLQYIGNVFNPGYDGCPPAALEKLGVSYDVMQTRIAPQSK